MTTKEKLRHKRILLSPLEIGRNMQNIVEELRRRGYDATSAGILNEHLDRLGSINDIQISSYHTHSRLKRHCGVLAFAIRAAINYDIFHFFFGYSLLYNRYTRLLDLKLLRKLRKTIFVHFRGSDVIGRAYFDYLRDKAIGKEVLEPSISDHNKKHRIKVWRRYAHRMLVSWPLLLEAIPDSIMVGQAIDLNYWSPAEARPKSCEDGIIRIVHAPTSRHKKGSEFVERAVNELKRMAYPVELILVENTNCEVAKQVYERCDIGIDQLILGWYGNYSIELMSLGKPVICYINPRWKDICKDLPILSAGPKNLTEKLKLLIENPQLRQDLGKRGIGYVKRHHDTKVIVDQCLGIYEQHL